MEEQRRKHITSSHLRSIQKGFAWTDEQTVNFISLRLECNASAKTVAPLYVSGLSSKEIRLIYDAKQALQSTSNKRNGISNLSVGIEQVAAFFMRFQNLRYVGTESLVKAIRNILLFSANPIPGVTDSQRVDALLRRAEAANITTSDEMMTVIRAERVGGS